jgi:hypothetical protein
MSDSESNERIPLGLICLPKDVMENDWKVATGYIEYSAELLRLSLLAITGLATLCLKLRGTVDPQLPPLTKTFQWPFYAFTLCAGCALFHRFIAVDSMGYHLESLRRWTRNYPEMLNEDKKATPSDRNLAEDQKNGRNRRFYIARYLLICAVIALIAGVICSAKPIERALLAP